jgi:hypothetical protein
MYGKRRDKRDKLGCFEHLTQAIAAGFDPSSKPAKILDKDHTSGGLLVMNAEDQRRIKSLLKKDLTSIQKHQEIIAFRIYLNLGMILQSVQKIMFLKVLVLKWFLVSLVDKVDEYIVCIDQCKNKIIICL